MRKLLKYIIITKLLLSTIFTIAQIPVKTSLFNHNLFTITPSAAGFSDEQIYNEISLDPSKRRISFVHIDDPEDGRYCSRT